MVMLKVTEQSDIGEERRILLLELSACMKTLSSRCNVDKEGKRNPTVAHKSGYQKTESNYFPPQNRLHSIMPMQLKLHKARLSCSAKHNLAL